jgi:hypothetical protein
MSLRLDPRTPLEQQDDLRKMTPQQRKAALCYACRALAAPYLCDGHHADGARCARPMCPYHVNTHGAQHYCLQHAKGV